MKKFLAVILSFLLFISAAGGVSATTHETIALGEPEAAYDWPQGLTVDGETIYVLDGTKVKQITYGNVDEYYDLMNLIGDLEPLVLNQNGVIQSFRLAHMEMHDGKLYLSGLLFLNLEDQNRISPKNELIIGETYNLLLSIENGIGKVLHLSKAQTNYYDPHAFYESDSGTAEDMYRWSNGYVLFDYAKYITYPRFSITEDGTIVYVRQQDENRMGIDVDDPYKAVGYLNEYVALKDGEERLLYKWHGIMNVTIRGGSEVGSLYHHVLPVLNGNQLDVYDGANHVEHIDLATNERVTTELAIEEPRFIEDSFDYISYLLERPIYRDGRVYFLNDDQVFSTEPTKKGDSILWNYTTMLTADEVEGTGGIKDFDFDGTYLYLLDYDNRLIHKVEPTASPVPVPGEIQVLLDGYRLIFEDAKPYQDPQAYRVMVPIRFVSEALDGVVGWNPGREEVVIVKDDKKVTLQIGVYAATVDGRTIPLDTAPVLISDRTYVPLRFISEAFHAKVEWDEGNRRVLISSPE